MWYVENLTYWRSSGSSNVGETLPTGQLSTIPWRRAGVKYTNNEAYFDVVEEIDAILDKSGETQLQFLFFLSGHIFCFKANAGVFFYFRNYGFRRNPGSYWRLCEALWNARPYSFIYGESFSTFWQISFQLHSLLPLNALSISIPLFNKSSRYK